MAGATLSTLSSLLKDYYLPPVVDQLNNEVLLLQRLEARDQELFGNRAVVPLHTSRSGGIGARAESAALPDPGNQAYATANYDLKYLYGRVRVTGPSMAKTASEAGAFLQALKSELDGIRADLRKDVARQVYADGTGIIATVGATANSTTVTLSSAEPLVKGQLYPGMVVDIGTVADVDAVNAAQTILSVDATGPTIVFAGMQNVTVSTHFIFRAGSTGNASAYYEIDHGLQKLVANTPTSGTVGTINRATAGNEYWRNLSTNVNGALSLDGMMQGFNRVRIAGGDVSSLITSFGVQRAYFNLLQSQVRYVNPTTIKGGFQSLDFNGKPLIADLEAPWGKLFFLDEKFIKVFSNRDWHFLDEDGDILKWRSGYDEWEAVLARYMNLGISRANVQLVHYGITDSVGY